jgi:hypothetical protein
MTVPENRDSIDTYVIAFVDFVPNHIKMGLTTAEDSLKLSFDRNLTGRVFRWGQLPSESIRIRKFEPLFRQARHLYIDGYYEAAVALCGMTVEALCISIAEDRVTDEALKGKLIDPSNTDIRGKINDLKNYFKVIKSASLLHQVLDIRKDYLHFHKTEVIPENVLECINKVHLIVLAEYGLVPDKGKFHFSTKEDVEERAKKMGIKL